MRRFGKIEIFLLFLLATETTAQAPRVVSVIVKPVEQHLTVSVQLADIFSPKIANTIRSGLPAVIRFDFRIVEEPNREARRIMRSVRILYDVWSERYRIAVNGREQIVSTFAEMEKFCAGFEAEKFLPLAQLSPTKTYRLRLQVAVIPISAKQDQQLRDWLEASDATEESAPGEERATGFSLNLSKLVSFFWGKKDRPFGTSEWAESSPFRL
ncbi:MAG: DUF4390 domain-containing protein [bacterium]